MNRDWNKMSIRSAFILFVSSLLSVFAVDLTVTPGAIGTEVVDATVQRIIVSDIFSDDFSLLRRIALVETADGTELAAATAATFAGGIWRLRETAFQETKQLTNGNWNSHYSNIKESALQIDWRDITYEDLRIPLISALAARIYVMMTSLPVDNVPYDIADQAAYWKEYYNVDGIMAEFVDKVTAAEQKQVCTIGVDVVFALDASLSVGDEGFSRSKNFVKEIVEAFTIGSRDDQTRVGCLQFAHDVTVAFDLGDHDNKDDILRAVDGIKYHGGGTAMGKAIDFIRQSSFSEERGARPVTYAVPRVAIILTDGKTNKAFPVLFPSALAHRDGITMYCIGVGEADDDDLAVIASQPAASHVLHVVNYQAIAYLGNIIASRTCKETKAVAIGQQIVTDLDDGEARFVSYEVDSTEGGTLKFMTSSGNVTIYLSSEVPNPNEAVHDYKLQTDGRVDIFIEPDLLGSTGRVRRMSASPSFVTVYTSIYAHGNDTQLFVESSLGNTAEPKFSGDHPGTVGCGITLPPQPPVVVPNFAPQRSGAVPVTKDAATVVVLLVAIIMHCASRFVI